MSHLILQHTEDEGPGSLVAWHQARGIPFQVFKSFLDKPFPELNTFQNLIVLGGPMNVDQEKEHTWLKNEKHFITNFLETKQGRYLGLCLGGQLLTRVLGAPVNKNPEREIGWHEVKKISSHPAFSAWPMLSQVFQWHEDTFEIPRGALPLFTNDACVNQAYAFGERAVGFQFHPESSAAWIELCLEDLKSIKRHEPFVQTKEEIRAKTQTLLPVMQQNFFAFLDAFLK